MGELDVLISRSSRAQQGDKDAQMGEMALLARHERICRPLIFFWKFTLFFKKYWKICNFN